MTADDIRSFLIRRGVHFTEQQIAYGMQFRCSSGEIVNVYDSGRSVLQGRTSALSREIQQMDDGGATEVSDAASVEPTPARTVLDKPVFIVYGHDTQARDGLELILRRMGVHPIVLQNLPARGDTVIEKLEQYLGAHSGIGFACVLLTPDDEGYEAGYPEQRKYRARQNVVLELGMVLARLGRSRVAILYKASVEVPSDIAGLIYIAFDERVEEAKDRLFVELREAGYDPNP